MTMYQKGGKGNNNNNKKKSILALPHCHKNKDVLN
jgi:hypothetical protein